MAFHASRAGNPKLSALWQLYETTHGEDKRAILWCATAIKQNEGNLEAASESLGIDRKTWYKWFARYPALRIARSRVMYELEEQRKRFPK